MQSRAESVIEKFLRPGAELEINVQSAVRNKATAAVEAMRARGGPATAAEIDGAFEESMAVVRMLMNDNSFKSFIDSDEARIYAAGLA